MYIGKFDGKRISAPTQGSSTGYGDSALHEACRKDVSEQRRAVKCTVTVIRRRSRRTGCPDHVSSGAAVGGAGGRAQMADGYLNFLQFRSFPREVSGLYVFCTLKRAELRI